MPKSETSFTLFLSFLVSISTFGLLSVPILLSRIEKVQFYPWFSKPLVGMLFSGLCIMGIIAVFFPKTCQNAFINTSKTENTRDRCEILSITKLSGHHPDCQMFSSNRVQFRKRVFCASCAGLLAGAVIALIGSTFYFIAGISILDENMGILWVGCLGLFIGLFQFKFRGITKSAINAIFVICSFLILAATDLLGRSLLMNFYVFGLICFLLGSRILFSSWNNQRTCNKCGRCIFFDEY
jgi:hypothetical protein